MPRDARKDFMIMCDVLRRLAQLSGKCWRNKMDIDKSKLTQETKDNYESLTIHKYPMKAEDLERLIKQSPNGDCLRLDRFYLPPLDADKDFIPVLSLKCNFRNAPPKIGLRIGMFSYDSNKSLRVFGFRFESGIIDSNHDYCHGQFTKKLFEDELPGMPDRMPETYPCILTPAKCPVSLIFCMLISFYGKKIQNTSVFSDLNLDSRYKEPLEYLNYAQAWSRV